MPKKKTPESQKDQSERFRAAVQELVDAGELNLIEAEERLSAFLGAMPSDSKAS